MKLSSVKEALKNCQEINFLLPAGQFIPKHFHITEVGMVTKKFIDCGGVLRDDRQVVFQLWEADDYDHRLAPQKLLDIIHLSEEKLGIPDDLDVEIEYQGSTIEKYNLDFDGINFMLITKQTDCLAQDKCGVPEKKPKIRLSDLGKTAGSCTPGSGCC